MKEQEREQGQIPTNITHDWASQQMDSQQQGYCRASHHQPYSSSNLEHENDYQAEPNQPSQENYCVWCHSQQHVMIRCGQFLNMPLAERVKNVQGGRICALCLKGYHSEFVCTGGWCSNCELPHNSLPYPMSEKKRMNKCDEYK